MFPRHKISHPGTFVDKGGGIDRLLICPRVTFMTVSLTFNFMSKQELEESPHGIISEVFDPLN